MTRFAVQGRIEIDVPPEVAFDYLCDPRHEADVTPLEDRLVAPPDSAPATGRAIECVGSVCTFRLDIAARTVEYRSRCRAYERPHRLTMDMDGALEGTQEWTFAPRGDGSEVTLAMDMAMPAFMHPYLQEPVAAEHWGQMLVDETLVNLKGQLEE
jgi:hypothetical protein